MPRGNVDHQPDQRFGLAFTLLAIGFPGGLVAWIWSVRDRLPDQIAHHWGVEGQATSTTELRTIIAFAIVLPLMTGLPLGLAAAFGRQALALRRALAGTASFLIVFITVLLAGSLRVQLDLTDGMEAIVPSAGLAVGLALASLISVGMGLTVRDDPTDVEARRASAPPPATAPRSEADDDHRPWEAPPTGVDLSSLIGSLFAAGLMVAVAAIASWWFILIALLILTLGGLAGRFRVRIDDQGLHVRVLGRRIVHVPTVEVARAEVMEVDPFWEFGGWGLRVDVAGRVGIVTRKGPALRVVRGDRSEVIITIDDADIAAAMLNGHADRRFGRSADELGSHPVPDGD